MVRWSFKVTTPSPQPPVWLCARVPSGRRRWVSLIKSRATRMADVDSLRSSLLEKFPKLEDVR